MKIETVHWEPPPYGPHWVAIEERFYRENEELVANYFGRPIYRRDFLVRYEKEFFYIFCFPDRNDALDFMISFEAELVVPTDIGRGRNSMKWYKGRTAKRRAKRSPYDFGM